MKQCQLVCFFAKKCKTKDQKGAQIEGILKKWSQKYKLIHGFVKKEKKNDSNAHNSIFSQRLVYTLRASDYQCLYTHLYRHLRCEF